YAHATERRLRSAHGASSVPPGRTSKLGCLNMVCMANPADQAPVGRRPLDGARCHGVELGPRGIANDAHILALGIAGPPDLTNVPRVQCPLPIRPARARHAEDGGDLDV